jgi:hypothetical protein
MASIPKHGRPKTCMVEQCNRPAETRGVCKSCYAHARILVLGGDSTWQELESLGLVMPAHKHPTKNPLKAAFLAAIEKREAAAKHSGASKARRSARPTVGAR